MTQSVSNINYGSNNPTQSLPSLNSITPWQPTPGMTWDQLRVAMLDQQQYGYTDARQQNYGRLQPGMAGYDPQKAANYDAMSQYGASQGWIQPHSASLSNIGKSFVSNVGPVAAAALGGYGLSTLGAGAGAGALGGSGASGLGGASGAVGATFGAPAVTGGGLAGAAGGIGGGVGAAGLGTGVGMGAGLAGTYAGLGATTGPAAAGAGGAAGASGGLNSFLSSTFGPGASAGGLGSVIGIGGQIISDLYSSGKYKDIANEAANRADPFASQRPQYQGMLQTHLTNPDSFMTSAPVADSMEAAARRAAAGGFNMSPNQVAEMGKAGLDRYYDHASLLSGLSGAGFGPGNAGSVYQQGQNQGEAQRYQGMANVGTLLGDLYSRYRGNNPSNSNYSLV